MRFLNESGRAVAATDPTRLVWFSAHCGYWTDDWDQLNTKRIPCCPKCGCPGRQTDGRGWDKGAREFDQQQPGYVEFLNAHKAECLKASGGMLKSWEAHLANRSD